jgi:hypothetical protein
VSPGEGGPRLVACTVERRGRFLVAQPFFDEGQQLALGRRSGLAVEAGELVVVERAGGSARVVERLGSPDALHVYVQLNSPMGIPSCLDTLDAEEDGANISIAAELPPPHGEVLEYHARYKPSRRADILYIRTDR